MPDKDQISLNFSRSAPDYEQHAVLQKQLADELFSSLGRLKPERILDIGCGTGYLTRNLAKKYPRAQVVGIDIAPGMIAVANANNQFGNLRFQIGDGEKFILNKSFDLVVSSASLQWMDAGKVFRAIQSNLLPGGSFIFTTFGPRTLQEMRKSGFRVNRFVPVGRLVELLDESFRVEKITSRMVEQYFKGVKELVCHLTEVGAQNPKPNRNVLSAFKKYREQFGQNGSIVASYEVISGAVIARPGRQVYNVTQ